MSSSSSSSSSLPYIGRISKIKVTDLTNVEMASIGWSGIKAAANDPYVKLSLGTWNDKTEFQDNAGSAASWDDLDISFKVTSETLQQDMIIQTLDYNSMTSHVLIGETSINLGSLTQAEKVGQITEFNVELKDKKGVFSGRLYIVVTVLIDQKTLDEQLRQEAEKAAAATKKKEDDIAAAAAKDPKLSLKSFPLYPNGYVGTINRIACSDLSNVEMGSLGWTGFTAGKNDPLVQLQFGSWSAKTEAKDDAGSAAEWNSLGYSFEATGRAVVHSNQTN